MPGCHESRNHLGKQKVQVPKVNIFGFVDAPLIVFFLQVLESVLKYIEATQPKFEKNMNQK